MYLKILCISDACIHGKVCVPVEQKDNFQTRCSQESCVMLKKCTSLHPLVVLYGMSLTPTKVMGRDQF